MHELCVYATYSMCVCGLMNMDVHKQACAFVRVNEGTCCEQTGVQLGHGRMKYKSKWTCMCVWARVWPCVPLHSKLAQATAAHTHATTSSKSVAYIKHVN